MIQRLKGLLNRYGVGGIKKSLHLAISQSFVAVLFILIDYVFSKQLSIYEFGAWKEIFFLFNLGIPLVAFGLPEGYKYFIAKDSRFEYFFNNVLTILLIISVGIFMIIGLTNIMHFSGLINLKQYYLYSLLFPLPLVGFLLNKTLRYTYINLDQAEKLTKLSAYGAIGSVIVILIGAYFVSQSKSLVILVAILIYFSIFFIPSIFYLIALPGIKLKFGMNKIAARQMLVYGFPLYLATFAGILSNYLDKLIVNVTSDEATFAIFAVGAFEIPIFAMLSAAFSQQIFPKMVRYVEDGQEDKAKDIWIDTTRKVSLITYPIILVVMFFAEEIIFLIYNKNYAASVILFKTYLLVALFRNNSYGILLTAKGETKIITKVSLLILTLNLIVSLTLYYFFDLIGIVFGTLISTFCMWFFYLYRESLFKAYFKAVILNKALLVFTILIIILYFL
ncbi:lipopolysaccharide biosynthesis protein [Ulvibacter antarcticus]|uniref:O-antigen/teichoic acid export membrane protein n=1 Tax=Ulvibacter antarcticus TaxID=442714 RepID=A0A3L9YIA2_9FLAO|nr:oligosaccharide flippase family protein [Ulvibacter antarcticus]RMA58949.1 O-antigen/teichoic acid export membrane protein [Ulvibacter antarcticus]